EIRISPLGVVGLSLGLAVGLLLFVAPRPHPGPAVTLRLPSRAQEAGGGAQPGADRTVVVRFMLEAPGARHVTVAGSFNDWNPTALPLEDVNAAGVFMATVALPPGVHEYMFVVDGKWITDPAAPERRPDGFGRQNALLRL